MLIGTVNFDMGEFSYESYKYHKLYLESMLPDSPYSFDEANQESYINIGIKGARMDGSPPKRISKTAEATKPATPGLKVQISTILFKNPGYVCTI